MTTLENKIEARHRTLFDVLNEQKYTVITSSVNLVGQKNTLRSWLLISPLF